HNRTFPMTNKPGSSTMEALSRAPAVLVFNVTRDVLLYGVKLTQQTYAVLMAACAHIAYGYRRFAAGVDRLTEKYNKVRQRLK
ncbi:hypothetical protein ANCDUO_27226, partial [Ancylostoma duodenale]